MKIAELLNEMPRLETRELPTVNSGIYKKFYSNESIKAKYDVLETKPFIIGISKDKTFAFIGAKGNREDDGVEGAFILGTIDFKKPVNISSTKNVELPERAIQVDGVEINKINQRRGVGYYLYLALIKAGYAVISDNLQYLGGQAIWKKVAKKAINNKYKVFIMDDEEIRMKDGKPEEYNGTNIDDAEIWSTGQKHVYTLLVAIKG